MAVDKYGYSLSALITANFFGILSFVSLLIIPECHDNCAIWPPVVMLILLGFYLSLFASVALPCIIRAVEIKYVGTAIGIANTFLNLCNNIIYLIL